MLEQTGETTRPRDDAVGPSPDVRINATPRARSRLEQALLCPFCRDAVSSRSGAVVCARSGCGAIYHRECWDECALSYGGCAVFGCESPTCRELRALGYVVRFLRLALAAILFPRRVVREIQITNVRVSIRGAVRVHMRCFLGDLRRYWYWPFVFIALPAAILLFAGVMLVPPEESALLRFVPASVWCTPWALAFGLMALLYGGLALF